MTDLVPAGDQIDRKALERIIQRAAELQAGEREIGDSLSEDQVMELGREVGLPARYLRQALMEERSRIDQSGAGFVTRWVGPTRIVAQRTVMGMETDLKAALGHWMDEQELLTVKRRYKGQTSWEARRDWLASVKRGLGIGGRRYALARAKEIVGEVRPLEDGWCHVTLMADLSNSRTEHVAGGATFAASFAAATGVGFVLGVAWPVALIPVAVGVAGGLGIARSRLRTVERIQVALEQVLDRLEHGEVKPPRAGEALPPAGHLVKALRDEMRRHLR